MNKWLLSLLGLLMSAHALADTPAYFDNHEKGWHWYEQTPVAEKPEQVTTPPDPTEQMSAVRATVTRALNQAILEPSEENVSNYIALQNQVSNRASQFANVWQKVLLNQPDLNYALVHPTSQIGSQVDTDAHHAKEDQAIAKLASETGLFFFYHSTCPYCQRFAPILKNFATRYGITVIPVTTDGVSLPEFPNSKIDAGQARKFNVTVEPALFAVNPYTHRAYPVSYGLLTEDDLRKRILDLANNFESSDER